MNYLVIFANRWLGGDFWFAMIILAIGAIGFLVVKIVENKEAILGLPRAVAGLFGELIYRLIRGFLMIGLFMCVGMTELVIKMSSLWLALFLYQDLQWSSWLCVIIGIVGFVFSFWIRVLHILEELNLDFNLREFFDL